MSIITDMKKFFNRQDKKFLFFFAVWLTITLVWGRIDALSLLAFIFGGAFILWQGLRKL